MAREDYRGKYIAVCGCGNVLRCKRPHDCNCRCGNYIPAGFFGPEKTQPYIIIEGFRGEKIKCYQQR